MAHQGPAKAGKATNMATKKKKKKAVTDEMHEAALAVIEEMIYDKRGRCYDLPDASDEDNEVYDLAFEMLEAFVKEQRAVRS
jgi:hypothetical protein